MYRGRVGEQVASPLVTLVDDGTMTGEWGAIGIDDEGHATQRNVLIQDGVLTDYMWDFLRARKEGRPQSGNGRRQSYQHLPMVRMTNTFVLNGADEPDDIIRRPTTACTSPSSAAAGQHGHGRLRVRHDRGLPDRERRDHRPDPRGQPHRQRPAGAAATSTCSATTSPWASPGTCGKDGQGVPVGDGQPTLRVKALTIGGTAA